MDSDRQVWVCQYINCQNNGSAEVLAAFSEHPVPDVTIVGSACQGQCNMGPTVRVLPDQTWYCRIKPSDVPEIVESHLKNGKPVERLLHPRMHPRFY